MKEFSASARFLSLIVHFK